MKAFTEQRRERQRDLRIIENEWWLRYSDEIQGYFDRGVNHNFYEALMEAFGQVDKSFSPVCATNGDLNNNKAGTPSGLAEYFRELLNRTNPTELIFIVAIQQ